MVRTVEGVDLFNPPQGFELSVGDVIVAQQERTLPLGPFLGTMLVALQEELDHFLVQFVNDSDERGVGLWPIKGTFRAEWTGAFTYELEASFKVVGFHSIPGKTATEVQLAGVHVLVYVIAGLVGLAMLGWISENGATIVTKGKEATIALAGSAMVWAVAIGLIALAWIVSKTARPAAAPAGA